MFKPLRLKRPQPFNISKTSISSNINIKIEKNKDLTWNKSQFMIPSPLLRQQQYRNSDKFHIFTPLFASKRQYPKKVQIQMQDINNKQNRGIGGYKDIYWYFKGRKIFIWNMQQCIQLPVYSDEINDIVIGQIKGVNFQKNIDRYNLIVGSQNTIQFFTLNRFTLNVVPMEMRETIQGFQVLKLKIFENSKLLVVSRNNIQIITFGVEKKSKKIKQTFLFKLFGNGYSGIQKQIQKIQITKNNIYILVNNVVKNNIFLSMIQSLYQERVNYYKTQKSIQVYSIFQNQIKIAYTYKEKDIVKKLKLYNSNNYSNTQIVNIYLINNQHGNSDLGVIMSNGYFLHLRSAPYVITQKQPLTLPKSYQIGECEFLGVKIFKQSLESTKMQDEREEQKTEIIASLGYNDLTLTNNALIVYGQNRIDCIASSLSYGYINIQKQSQDQYGVQKYKQWTLFTYDNYFIVQQLPLRNFIAGMVNSQINIRQELAMHKNKDRYGEYIQKIIKRITPEKFLQCLIQLVVSRDKLIIINKCCISNIDRQLRGQKLKDFRDWELSLNGNLQRQDIIVTKQLTQKFYELIEQLQKRKIPRNELKNNKRFNNNIYWLAMKNIFYSIIKPILYLDDKQIVDYKQQVQNIRQVFEQFNKFILKKQRLYTNQNIQNIQNKMQLQKTFDIQSIINEQIINNTNKRIINIQKKQNIIQNQIKTSFHSIPILISLFYSISKIKHSNLLLQDQQQIKKLSSIKFKDFLTSPFYQSEIKDKLLQINNIYMLQQLQKQLPQMNIDKQIKSKVWINKIMLQRQDQQIVAQKCAQFVKSKYFSKIDQAFGDNYNLKLKLLQQYQKLLIKQSSSLIKANTLEQRQFIDKSIFGEDEMQLLKYKRGKIDNQFLLIFEQKKKLIKMAIQRYKNGNNTKQLKIMLQNLINMASEKTILAQILESQFIQQDLDRQAIRLKQKIQELSMKKLKKGNQYYKIFT